MNNAKTEQEMDNAMRPNFTVLTNLQQPEVGGWVGQSWEFFNDQAKAMQCYNERTAQGHFPVLRPFHEAVDAPHLHHLQCKSKIAAPLAPPTPSESQHVDRRTWAEFRKSGLLWWVNRILHTFGWALVVEADERGATTDVYPARVCVRGFDVDAEARGFKAISTYLAENAQQLENEAHS